MTTFFESLTKSYVNVALIDGTNIETESFLQATESLIKLFDLINGTAFGPVKSDMKGNIDKIRIRYKSDPKTNATLESLVLAEKGEKKRPATEALLWLKRGLEFTSLALRRNMDDAAEELSTSFTKAYEGTLRPFHSMLIRPIFALAMKACPYRKDFYLKLGQDQEVVLKQFREWLSALEKIVGIIVKFYVDGGHDKGF